MVKKYSFFFIIKSENWCPTIDVLKCPTNLKLGFKLGNLWEDYASEQHKVSWTNLYLTSLELEKFAERKQTEQLQDCILYAINYGPNGFKANVLSDMEFHEDYNVEKVMKISTTKLNGDLLKSMDHIKLNGSQIE